MILHMHAFNVSTRPVLASSSRNNKESLYVFQFSSREKKEEEKMRGWKDLGVVETIYEEELEDDSYSPASTLILSPITTPSPPHCPSSPPPSSLQSRIVEWSQATGCKTDVVIRVHDHLFQLHKDPLTSRNGYLRRHLAESSDITVSPPSNIKAETFAAVADFCYGADVAVTPFNVAALRTAAEWLEMTEDYGDGVWNLLEKTEGYFRRAVASNAEYAAIVLRTCRGILPEAEKTASLASRCLEALALADGVDGDDGIGGWLDDVPSFVAEDFQMIAGSMSARFTRSHDLLYRIVDYYLENRTGRKLTEEEKIRICYSVDSKKLSPRLLMHLIQNPRMPLRYVVQAMLVEQLQTRRSIFDRVRKPRDDSGVTSLGAILQRDAALHQVAHLKATMEATSLKIQCLERDLANMKRRLRPSEERRTAESEPVRSASFRLFGSEEKADVEGWASSCNGNSKNIGTSLSRKLMRGFENVFRKPRLGSVSRGTSSGGGGDGGVVVAEEKRPTHRRHHSFA